MFEYVYYVLQNVDTREVDYYLEANTVGLNLGGWTSNFNYTATGIMNVENGMRAVTNQIPTDVDDTKFIRVKAVAQ